MNTAEGSSGDRPVAFGRPARISSRVVVAAATVLAYLTSFGGVFIFDDQLLWDEEAALQRPADLLGKPRPIGMLTFAVNYHLHGFSDDGFHAINLLIHILAALALFGIARRTLQSDRLSPRLNAGALLLATVIALLWAVHPLHTQSVTYIIQRFESLMGLFYLLTLYCFIRATGVGGRAGREGGSMGAQPMRFLWWMGSVVSCALGMGSKEVMITAPLMVLWYDRVFVAASWKELLSRRWIYYLALASIAAVVLWPMISLVIKNLTPQLLQGESGSAAIDPSSSLVAVKGLTPLSYLYSQPGVILHYLKLSFWPVGLCLDYGWPVADTWRDILLPGAIIATFLLATLWSIWRKPALGFLGGWFFIILAPTSTIIPVRDLAFEHRMYLPLAAVVAFAVLALYEGISRLGWSDELSTLRPAGVATALSAIAAIALGIVTLVRNLDYHSEIGMWSDVAAKRPHSRRGHYNLGASLVKSDQLKSGRDAYLEALRIEPDYAMTHQQLGSVYRQLGNLGKAIEHLHRALQLDPALATAHYELATALLESGEIEQAVYYYRRTLQLDPNHLDAQRHLAVALEELRTSSKK